MTKKPTGAHHKWKTIRHKSEATSKRRTFYDDYLTATLDVDAKWVTDSFTKDRRIALYGIGIAITQRGEAVHVDPVIPCAGPLSKLVLANPQETTFRFDRKKRKWKVINE